MEGPRSRRQRRYSPFAKTELEKKVENGNADEPAPTKTMPFSMLFELKTLSAQLFGLIDDNDCQQFFDITKGIELAERECQLMAFSISEAEITLEKLVKRNQNIDEAYAMTTDLSRPLLFFRSGGKDQLIDGHHRLMKALKLGTDTLHAYILTKEQADSVLLVKLPPGRRFYW